MNVGNIYGVAYPRIPSAVAALPSESSIVTIDDAADEASFVFQAPKTGTINKIFFRTGVVTTGCTLDVRLESLDVETGLASGSLKSADSNASQVIANTDDNKTFLVTLTSGASVTEGDWLAIRFDVASGTPANLSIAVFLDDDIPYGPYHIEGPTAAATTSPIFAVEYSDGSYPYILGVWPFSTVIATTFNNTSTPDIVGNKFKLEFGARAYGGWAWVDADASGYLNVYDPDGSTVIASGLIRTNIPPVLTAGAHHISFDSSVYLTGGNYYYMGFEPYSASNVIAYGLQTTNSGVNNALLAPDFFAATTKTPTGVSSWTENTSGIYFMGLLLNGIETGSAPASTGSSEKFYSFVV